jgi:cytochrome c-type biogenesis protein
LEKVSFILAFSAGLLSFLSPCVLPLIPAYLSYIAGTAVSEINSNKAKRNLLLNSIFFIIGFSVVFIVLGATVSSISKLFAANLNIIKKVGGIVIIIFGLHMTGIFKIKMLYSERKFLPNGKSKNYISSIFLGMAFAFGWTPCIGPILSSILIYAGSMATIGKGILLLIMYSLGLAVPFFLSALLIGNSTNYIKKLSKFLPVVSVVSGIIMIIMGLLVFTNKLAIISRFFNFISF